MSRNQRLAVGALLYAIFAADAIIHIAAGDWALPVVATTVAIVCTALVTMRRVRWSQPEAAA
jgi:hypothetical protein